MPEPTGAGTTGAGVAAAGKTALTVGAGAASVDIVREMFYKLTGTAGELASVMITDVIPGFTGATEAGEKFRTKLYEIAIYSGHSTRAINELAGSLLATANAARMDIEELAELVRAVERASAVFSVNARTVEQVALIMEKGFGLATRENIQEVLNLLQKYPDLLKQIQAGLDPGMIARLWQEAGPEAARVVEKLSNQLHGFGEELDKSFIGRLRESNRIISEFENRILMAGKNVATAHPILTDVLGLAFTAIAGFAGWRFIEILRGGGRAAGRAAGRVAGRVISTGGITATIAQAQQEAIQEAVEKITVSGAIHTALLETWEKFKPAIMVILPVITAEVTRLLISYYGGRPRPGETEEERERRERRAQAIGGAAGLAVTLGMGIVGALTGNPLLLAGAIASGTLQLTQAITRDVQSREEERNRLRQQLLEQGILERAMQEWMARGGEKRGTGRRGRGTLAETDIVRYYERQLGRRRMQQLFPELYEAPTFTRVLSWNEELNRGYENRLKPLREAAQLENEIATTLSSMGRPSGEVAERYRQAAEYAKRQVEVYRQAVENNQKLLEISDAYHERQVAILQQQGKRQEANELDRKYQENRLVLVNRLTEAQKNLLQAHAQYLKNIMDAYEAEKKHFDLLAQRTQNIINFANQVGISPLALQAEYSKRIQYYDEQIAILEKEIATARAGNNKERVLELESQKEQLEMEKIRVMLIDSLRAKYDAQLFMIEQQRSRLQALQTIYNEMQMPFGERIKLAAAAAQVELNNYNIQLRMLQELTARVEEVNRKKMSGLELTKSENELYQIGWKLIEQQKTAVIQALQAYIQAIAYARRSWLEGFTAQFLAHPARGTVLPATVSGGERLGSAWFEGAILGTSFGRPTQTWEEIMHSAFGTPVQQRAFVEKATADVLGNKITEGVTRGIFSTPTPQRVLIEKASIDALGNKITEGITHSISRMSTPQSELIEKAATDILRVRSIFRTPTPQSESVEKATTDILSNKVTDETIRNIFRTPIQQRVFVEKAATDVLGNRIIEGITHSISRMFTPQKVFVEKATIDTLGDRIIEGIAHSVSKMSTPQKVFVEKATTDTLSNKITEDIFRTPMPQRVLIEKAATDILGDRIIEGVTHSISRMPIPQKVFVEKAATDTPNNKITEDIFRTPIQQRVFVEKASIDTLGNRVIEGIAHSISRMSTPQKVLVEKATTDTLNNKITDETIRNIFRTPMQQRVFVEKATTDVLGNKITEGIKLGLSNATFKIYLGPTEIAEFKKAIVEVSKESLSGEIRLH